MCYYHIIWLDPEASKICSIIFPWGKYSYLGLPMGIAGSPDVFQVKMSELMVDLEFIQSYIDDLLYIPWASLHNHLQKLDRNQQSDNVSVTEIIMVFHFEKYFLFNLCEPSMNENFALSKAVLYHIWKIKFHIKTNKRSSNGAWGLIEVRIWILSHGRIGNSDTS